MVARFPDRERRCGRSVPIASMRIALSLLRRRSRALSRPVVDIGGARVIADVRTPHGVGLYRYGFCSAEARLLKRLLRPGDIFVDGGANIGLLSLVGAVAVGPTGRVIACEPAPGTMALLRENAGKNRFRTLELHEVAISDQLGSINFTIFEAGSGLASFAPKAADGEQVEVAATTLDALTTRLDAQVALVKLDIEGAEARALRGAAGLIARDTPMFLVELEPEHLARQGASIADVRAVLEPHGYEAYAITTDAQLTRLDTDWRPCDPSAPNVVLAPPSRAGRLSHGHGDSSKQ
jgi:FkbM family methyltransferase